MGADLSSGSERASTSEPGVHTYTVRAQNTGKCVEDAVSDGETCLHLGSGRHHWPGWINIDQDSRADFQCDIRQLTYADEYADRIAAIHVFEHFYYWDIPAVLAEWKRVLKPGGTLILELPCMDKVVEYMVRFYTAQKTMSPVFSCYPLWGDPSYKDPGMCHKWGYFKGNMAPILQDAGFVNVQHEDARYHFPQRDMRVTATKGA